MYLSFLYYRLKAAGYSLLISDSFQNTRTCVSDFAIYYPGLSLRSHCLYIVDCATGIPPELPNDFIAVFCHAKGRPDPITAGFFLISNEPTAQLINNISEIFKNYTTLFTLFRDRTSTLDDITQSVYRTLLVPCTLIDSSFESLSSAGSFSELLYDPEEKESINHQMIWDRSFYDVQTAATAFIYENYALTDGTTYMLFFYLTNSKPYC